MDGADAGVCRTCLSSKAQLFEMQQAVPNLELMTYKDILDFCANINTPENQRSRSFTKCPSHICLRCSKALEVSYHFLKMLRNTDAVLQGQVTDEQLIEDAELYAAKKEAPAHLNVAVVMDNKQATKQKQQRKMPTAFVSGVQKDLTMEDSQMLEPFANCESPSKALWNNNVMKSDLNSIDEYKNFDWLDTVSFGISDNFGNSEDEKNINLTNIALEDELFASISQDKYFTDSETVDCCEIFNQNGQSDNLPNNVLATQMNVPNENPLTEDFLNKNSITKAVDNAKKDLTKTLLNDFEDDLKENSFYDESEVNSSEEEFNYSSDDDEVLKNTIKQLVCGLCDVAFTNINEYTRHVNRHNGIIPVRCKHCNFSSCFPESMRKHYIKKHCVQPTNVMLNGPINPHKLPEEQKFHAKTYQCTKCTKTSNKRRDIRLHLLSQHHVMNNADNLILSNYNCPECRRSFKYRHGMRLHFMRAHGKQKDEPPAPGETFQCQTCAKVFPLKHSLRTHQRVCEGPTNVFCNLCSKYYNSVRKFEQHLLQEHGVEMIHECEICCKTFKTANYLSAHRKRHTERIFRCQLCPKSYVNKCELRLHIDRKHNTETKALCGACGASFTNLTSLRTHETKEHSKKLHSCSHCGFKTTTVSRLKLHQYSHTGMPYRCTMCDKGFAFRLFMRRHSLAVHKISLSDTDLADMFWRNMGYPSRYDVFSNADYALDIPEVIEEDIERELSEFGLNFDDIMRDIFDEKELSNGV